MRKTAFVVVALLTLAQWMALPAEAVEYRLRVASLWENGLVSFLSPGEVLDGASGPGLDKLEARLDAADFPRGALLYDRHLQLGGEDTARAFGAVAVRGSVTLGGGATQVWDEVSWEGKPGEQSVWVVERLGPPGPGDRASCGQGHGADAPLPGVHLAGGSGALQCDENAAWLPPIRGSGVGSTPSTWRRGST
jgi:hypothetical protein